MNEENTKPEEIIAELSTEKVQEVKQTPKPAPAKPVTSKPEQKYAIPVAVTLEDIENLRPVPAGPAVVSNNEVDDVHLDRIIYKNLYSRKSLSVHHLQRRLNELGYTEAIEDKDGYYGDKTKFAIARFQVENDLDGDGTIDAKTLTLLFTGDPNVNVIV